MLEAAFFNQDAKHVAISLLGKVIRHRYNNTWLSCQIIETEAYYASEKGSHSSLGFTQKRKAMFMPPGTIYMYYARGADSLNISVKGEGNAVLIKSAIPYTDAYSPVSTIKLMQRLNPIAHSNKKRSAEKLCSGQTLLCRSLHLKVGDWDQKSFDINHFYIEATGQPVSKYIQTTRLGIPAGRDEQLMYRFIDHTHRKVCSQNPLTRRDYQEGKHYYVKYNVSTSR
jgi:DNA-3-methyladenine glycosylase